MLMAIKRLSFSLLTEKVSEFDPWVMFQESSGLMPYMKINISQVQNTFKPGGRGVTQTIRTSMDTQ